MNYNLKIKKKDSAMLLDTLLAHENFEVIVQVNTTNYPLKFQQFLVDNSIDRFRIHQKDLDHIYVDKIFEAKLGLNCVLFVVPSELYLEFMSFVKDLEDEFFVYCSIYHYKFVHKHFCSKSVYDGYKDFFLFHKYKFNSLKHILGLHHCRFFFLKSLNVYVKSISQEEKD